MNTLKKAIIATLCITGVGTHISLAQTAAQDSVLTDTLPGNDNFVKAVDLSHSKPFPYPKTNAASIRLYAQVWRDIDLNDTANANLAIPDKSLIENIMKGLKSGKLTPYELDDFKKKLTARQGEMRFADSVVVQEFDKDGNQIGSHMALNDFDPAKVRHFRIKEDVYFDRQRGKVDTRIIGLAPMMRVGTSAELEDAMAYTPAFWLYFPQLRYSLVTQDIGNDEKEDYTLTLDDIFMQHRFKARLVREATPGGLQTGNLAADSPEAIKIEQKLAELKQNVWKSPRGINADKLEKATDKPIAKKKEDSHDKDRETH